VADGRPTVAVTDQHKALSEFVGTWDAVERTFPAPGSEPYVRKGKTSCRTIVDGRVALMETELDGGKYHSMVVATWNVHKSAYEGYFLDVHSHDGFDPMKGSKVAGVHLPKGHGLHAAAASALSHDGPVKRTWDGSVTVPRKAAMFAGGPEVLLGVDRLNYQFVENQLSHDKWVFLGVLHDEHGKDYVGLEATYTRA
jgi:hypothetical protein